MHDYTVPAPQHPLRQMLPLCLVPLLVMAVLSLACNAERFKYGEHFRATEEFVSAQSTAYAQTVRAAATTEAPAISATATAIAQAALTGAPENIRSLHGAAGWPGPSRPGAD